MELKRISGPDAKTALRRVREQLGPNAMILSNRPLDGGVEIVAVAESDTRGGLATEEGAQVQGMASQLRELQTELRSMRALLDSSLTAIRRSATMNVPGVEGYVWQRLTRLGLPNAMVQRLISRLEATVDEEQAWLAAVQRLADGVHAVDDPVSGGGVWACIGSTGAGKTTTICKLAVRHAFAHGTEGMALISMDSSRIGGADMLRTVARLLDVPFHVVHSGEALARLLDELSGSRLVLIDTPGAAHMAAPGATRLRELAALRSRIATLLVLPATTQFACLEKTVRDYAECAPTAAVVTRVDEASSLGEVIGALTLSGLPLAYLGDGTDIPDDLRTGSGDELVAMALQLDTTAAPDGVTADPSAAQRNDCSARVADTGNAARIVG